MLLWHTVSNTADIRRSTLVEKTIYTLYRLSAVVELSWLYGRVSRVRAELGAE